MQLEFKLDSLELETTIDKLLQDKLDNSDFQIHLQSNNIKQIVSQFRAYGLTKQKATEYASRSIKLGLTVETIMSSHYELIRKEEKEKNMRLIKYYIKEVSKVTGNYENSWNMLYKEVANKTGYEVIKIASEWKAKQKKKVTGVDVIFTLNLEKEVASISKRLYNKTLKESKTK